MKKYRSFLLAVMVFIALPIFSLAYGFDKNDNPLNIVFCYSQWESEFGVTSANDELDYSVSGNIETLYAGDLIIVDDTDKSIIQKVLFNYFNVGKDESQQALKAMSMFAALEYGMPTDWTDVKMITEVAECKSFIDHLNNALLNYTDDLAKGKIIPFYVSSRFTYVVTANKQDGIVITVA